MKIDIWSDVVCPFCYIGKRHLESALAQFPHRDQVEVRWHSFQLDPDAPAVSSEPTSEMLARKYGMSVEQARQSQQQLEATAATVGLEYHLDRTTLGNTFDAHRLLHLATSEGAGDAAQERFMSGYFTDGEGIGDHQTLVRMATDVGLDGDRVREVLAGDEFAEEVHADIARARAYGANGVPFFVFAESVAVSGAQPIEVFSQALTQGWAAAHPLQMVGGSHAETCSGDSCAI